METVYSARPRLHEFRRFLADAAGSLRRAPGTAFRLYRSELRARNRRAALAYVWLLLPAAGTALVCSYIQSRRVVAIAPTELPYPLFVLSGVLLWQIFAEALNAPLHQLQANRLIATRTRVPHEAVILAGALRTLANAALRMGVLLPVLLLFDVPLSASALLVPLGVLCLVLLGLALGLLVAPLGLLYDDVARGLLVVSGFWLFLTPVIYPLPAAGWLRLNPVSPVLDTTRTWLTSAEVDGGFILVAGLSLAGLVFAWLLYRLAQPHLVARIA